MVCRAWPSSSVMFVIAVQRATNMPERRGLVTRVISVNQPDSITIGFWALWSLLITSRVYII